MLTNYFRSKKFTACRPALSLDFSPMSALGLLLINFFMAQMMWKKPQMMPLTMPKASEGCCSDGQVKNNKILHLLCGPERIYAYTGITAPKLDSVDYSAEGLRKLILREKEMVDRQFGTDVYTDSATGALKKGSFLYVLIKPLPTSRYGNLVDVLDEMRICGVRYFTVIDPMPIELALIREPQKGWPFTDLE